jgi:hypothetical protein
MFFVVGVKLMMGKESVKKGMVNGGKLFAVLKKYEDK